MKKFVVISGIDGSGKTSVIEALQKRLEDRGLKTHYVWMRYTHVLCKPLHGLCRLIGLSKKYDTRMGKVWRHEFYKSQVFCSFYIFLTWLDTWLGKIKLIRQLKGSDANIIICDRWVNDIIIDLAVKTHRTDFINSSWYKRFQKIQPNGTIQFIIHRNTEAVIECRLENQDDPEFGLRQNIYNVLMENGYIVKVDNTGTIDNSVGQILDHLSN